MTVWHPTSDLGAFAWYGAGPNMVNFPELDRAGSDTRHPRPDDDADHSAGDRGEAADDRAVGDVGEQGGDRRAAPIVT